MDSFWNKENAANHFHAFSSLLKTCCHLQTHIPLFFPLSPFFSHQDKAIQDICCSTTRHKWQAAAAQGQRDTICMGMPSMIASSNGCALVFFRHASARWNVKERTAPPPGGSPRFFIISSLFHLLSTHEATAPGERDLTSTAVQPARRKGSFYVCAIPEGEETKYKKTNERFF